MVVIDRNKTISKINKKIPNHKETASSGLNVNHSSIDKVSDENNTSNVFQGRFLYYKSFCFLGCYISILVIYITEYI